jgi:hypothetical protein
MSLNIKQLFEKLGGQACLIVVIGRGEKAGVGFELKGKGSKVGKGRGVED